MRVKEGTLTPRQTELMEFLWEANEPIKWQRNWRPPDGTM